MTANFEILVPNHSPIKLNIAGKFCFFNSIGRKRSLVPLNSFER